MIFTPETLTVIFGLASALTWGAADFSGGIATKRTAATIVVFLSQLVGWVSLLLTAVVLRESFPGWEDVGYGGLAGLCGMGGLLALYHGLGHGQMGIVAPVAALVTAILPVAIGFYWEGMPPPVTTMGIILALAAVWILSAGGQQGRFSSRDVIIGAVAGVGLGLFLVFIDLSSETVVFWPLVAGRTASVVSLGAFITIRGGWQRPAVGGWRPIIAAGLLDSAGNALFALATQFGRLDIAAILSSLYPGSTILLARLVLKERLSSGQQLGVGLTLVALVLITL